MVNFREGWNRFSSAWISFRSSSTLVIVVIFFALCLDYMLISCIIPILPSYLAQIKGSHKPEQKSVYNCTPPTSHDLHYSTPSFTQEQTRRFKEPEILQSSDPCALMLNESVSSNASNTSTIQMNESGWIGILLSTNAFVQCICNPIVSIITRKYGSRFPMLFGCLVTFIGTVMFAFSNTYGTLLLWRAVQGAGSSFTNVGGMTLLTQRFSDDAERGIAMGRAMSGSWFGCTVGMVYGGLMYHYYGIEAPLLILAGLIIVDALFRALIIIPPNLSSNSSNTENPSQEAISLINSDGSPSSISNSDENVVSTWKFLCDPTVVIITSTIVLVQVCVAMLDSILPIYIMINMNISIIGQSLVFLPMTISLFLTENVFGWLAYKIGRWLSGSIGLIVGILSLVGLSFSNNYPMVMICMVFIGISVGMIDTFALPTLTLIIDQKYSKSMYSTAFAIYSTSFTLGLTIGPALGGGLASGVGFKWTVIISALILCLLSPFLFVAAIRASRTNEKEKASTDE